MTRRRGQKPVPILQTPADERNPQVSPDGKWIAYSSNETGEAKSTSGPFPGPRQNSGVGQRRRVSRAGGVTGRELSFMNLVVSGLDDGVRHPRQRRSVQREVPRTLFQSLFAR